MFTDNRENKLVFFGLQNLVGLQDLRFYTDGSLTPSIWFNDEREPDRFMKSSCAVAKSTGSRHLLNEEKNRDRAFIICKGTNGTCHRCCIWPYEYTYELLTLQDAK